MSTWQQFLAWCSEKDRYPEIFHLTRDGQYARIYSGNITFDNLLARGWDGG
jgi:hypothetical protein